jgi:hypothetical protein
MFVQLRGSSGRTTLFQLRRLSHYDLGRGCADRERYEAGGVEIAQIEKKTFKLMLKHNL